MTYQKLILLVALLAMLGCSSAPKDPLYLNYKNFANEMDAAAERGEITKAQAATAKHEAYLKYVEVHEQTNAMARQRQSQSSTDYVNFLQQLASQTEQFTNYY